MLKNKTRYIETLSPHAIRECACGCGMKFRPNRKDKKYLNSKHANYHYNSTKRKKPDIRINSINKILQNNDAILAKFFERLSAEKLAIVPFELLRIEGFDSARFVGEVKRNGYTVFFSYNYRYYFDKDNIKNIIISKI